MPCLVEDLLFEVTDGEEELLQLGEEAEMIVNVRHKEILSDA